MVTQGVERILMYLTTVISKLPHATESEEHKRPQQAKVQRITDCMECETLDRTPV